MSVAYKCERCGTYEALKKEKESLELTLAGVMHSVDKWLDGPELELDEVNRAIRMREKTLDIVEKLARDGDRKELIRLLTMAKDDLLYLLLKRKADRGSISALSAMVKHELETAFTQEKLDADFNELCRFLEENDEKRSD